MKNRNHRHVLSLLGSLTLCFTSSQAQTAGNWNYNGTLGASNSWNTVGSWLSSSLINGLVPNATGATVNFTFNISGTRTITLNGDRIVGTMSIDDPTPNPGYQVYAFSPGTPTTSQLIFDVDSGTAALNTATAANNLTNTISCGITLNDPLEITTAKTDITGGLNLSGVITDGASSHSITKNGNGAVIFEAANTYDGGTTISGGRIQAITATSFGTGTVSVTSGGQAFLGSNLAYANNFNLAGDGYVNTSDSGALNGSLRFSANTILSGIVTLTGNARIGGFGSSAVGTISNTLTGGAFNLEVNGSSNASFLGNLIVTGNAAGLTGTVTVTQGSLSLGTSSNLGGSVVVKDGAALFGENIGTPGAAVIGGSLTLGNSGSTTTGATLNIDPSTNGALQVNGDLTLNGSNTVNLTGPLTGTSFNVMTYTGSVLAGGAANFTLAGGLAGYRSGTGFSVSGGLVKLDIVLGDVTWTGAANSAWNTTDTNWSDGAATTFYNLDSVTFDETSAAKATYTTNLANATNNDLVFTAVAGGAAGENLIVEYVNPFTPSSALLVSVSGNTITVALETDALGLIVSTASQVKSAIEASVPASALATVALAASDDGSGLVTTLFGTFAIPNPAITIATGLSVNPSAMTFDHGIIDYSISGTGVIGGSGSLTKSGTGMLTISTPNTYSGGTSLSAGRLRIGNATALGTGLITITGGQLSSDSSTARSLTNPLSLSNSIILGDSADSGALTFSGATTLFANTTLNCGAANTVTHIIGAVITDGADSFRLTKSGSAHLQLNTANTYDGGTTIESSRIQAGNIASFGTGTVKVLSGGQAFFTVGGTNTNNYEIEGSGWTESSGNLGAIRLTGTTLSGAITLTGDARITAHGSTGALTGNISETGGARALELSNYSTATDSTITVSGNNSYSLGTIVKGAVVVANSNNTFGTGPISIESNGTAARITRVQLGTDVVINNDITIKSNAQTGFRGAIHSYSGSLTTPSLAIVNGTIEIQGAMGNGGHIAAESASLSVLRVMGAINVTNSSVVPLVRLGNVELGGGGNYIQLNHGEGSLKLAAANGISSAAAVNLGLSGASVFDLNGFDQTLAGMTKGANNVTVINNGASPATLTLNMASSGTYAGTFALGTSALHLVKSGAGTLTLSAASSALTGSLSVTQGGLNLTAPLGEATFHSSMSSGTMLSGESTFGGNLTLSGTTMQVNGVTPLGIFAAGNLDTTGGVNVDLVSLPTNTNPIEVIAFGSITGAAANFTLLGASNYRNPQFQVLANNVTLSFGAASDLTWTGAGGSTWDVNTTSNWENAAMAPSTFLFGDNVIFGDTPASDQTISVASSLTAGNMVFTNATYNYTFNGSGTIGAASITKSGAAAVSFESAVNFPGAIALNAGTLRFSPPTGVTTTLPGALSGSGTLVKGGDGILSLPNANAGFTGSMVISKGEVIPGNNAAFGAAKVFFGDASTQATDICKLTLNTGIALASSQLEVTATCLDARIASTGGTITGTTITKKGPGKLTIGHATDLASTTSVLTGTSPVTIEQGTLAGSSMTPMSASTTITMGNASTGTAPTILEVPASQSGSNDFTTFSCPLVLSASAPNSEAIIRYAGGTSVLAPSISSTISLNGRDLYLENTSGSNLPTRLYNVSGNITGSGNVRVRAGTLASGLADGATRLRITGTGNTFTGDLYIQTGNLQTGFTTNHIPDSALVIMSAGTAMGFAATADTIRGLVGGAATETVPFRASINQGRGDTTISRLTVSDSNAANIHVFHGTLANGAGPFAFTKASAATQVLNGVNTYTGTTIVTGGTLEIGGAGQLGSGTYSSAMTLTSPGILKFNSTADQLLQTGVISSTGALVKENTGTLTLTAANTFSGNITVSGGKLIGKGATNASPGVTVFGSRTNTRVFTINNGGTLQFDSGNILGSGHNTTTAPKLVINSGGVVTNGSTATNNALNDIELNGGTLTSTTGHTSSSDPFTPVYGAWNLNGAVTSTGTSTISTTDATKGWIMLKVVGDKITNFNVTSGTLTVSAPVVDNPTDSNIGSLNKSGAGTMVMSGANTYTGNTTVSAGTLALADNAQLKFVLGASTGLNNSISGAGTVTLDGDFVIDTSAADALASGSWTLENVPSLGGAYGVSFTVVGFTDAGNNKWTKVNGVKTYSFDETTGVLTLTAAGYASWAALNGASANLNDDHDNDGVSNGIEYFIGGPSGNTTGFTALPSVVKALDNTLSVTWTKAATYTGTYGTDFVVETSDTLTGTWATEIADPNLGFTVTFPSATEVKFTFPGGPAYSGKKFARLKVTGP
jgi:fibronectin-binding autotransporter adhesin